MKEKITSDDCRRCGACCVAPSQQEVFCDVSVADEKRLGKRFVRLNVLQPSTLTMFAGLLVGDQMPGAIKTTWAEQKAGPLKGLQLNTCAALRGSVMNQVSCRVYDRRPRVCRIAVKPGDRVCREIRRAFKQHVEDLESP